MVTRIRKGLTAAAIWVDGFVSTRQYLLKYSSGKRLDEYGIDRDVAKDVVQGLGSNKFDHEQRFKDLFRVYKTVFFPRTRGPPQFIYLTPPMQRPDTDRIRRDYSARSERPHAERFCLDNLEFLKYGPHGERADTKIRRYRQVFSVVDKRDLRHQERFRRDMTSNILSSTWNGDFRYSGLSDYFSDEIDYVLGRAISLYESNAEDWANDMATWLEERDFKVDLI